MAVSIEAHGSICGFHNHFTTSAFLEPCQHQLILHNLNCSIWQAKLCANTKHCEKKQVKFHSIQVLVKDPLLLKNYNSLIFLNLHTRFEPCMVNFI
jgi:hypothetical protein